MVQGACGRGLYVLARMSWSACLGLYVLVCMSWPVCLGLYVLGLLPWLCCLGIPVRVRDLPGPNAPGERRPTGTEPRMKTEPTLWAVRSTGLLGAGVSTTRRFPARIFPPCGLA